MLLIRNPKDAFSLLSTQEKQKDAIGIFLFYIFIRFPFLAQRYYVKNDLPFIRDMPFSVFLSLIFLLSAIVAFISILFFAGILHVIINKIKRTGSAYSDMLILVILCLTPQLLLIIEIPSLIMNFNSYESFTGFVLLRFFYTILSFRILYWGTKSMKSLKSISNE